MSHCGCVMCQGPPGSFSLVSFVVEETREAKERDAGIEDVAWQGSNLRIDSNRVGYG